MKKTYFSIADMCSALDVIEAQLNGSDFYPDVILGVNRGGCVPGVYLSHRLDLPHMVIDVRLRDHVAPPNFMELDRLLMENNKVLIVDDINDSGATFRCILEHIGRHKQQAEVRFAALINNAQSAVDLDYFGKAIDKSVHPQWIVFPWETRKTDAF